MQQEEEKAEQRKRVRAEKRALKKKKKTGGGDRRKAEEEEEEKEWGEDEEGRGNTPNLQRGCKTVENLFPTHLRMSARMLPTLWITRRVRPCLPPSWPVRATTGHTCDPSDWGG